MARTPRERSRLVYLLDLHLPSGLRRYSSDEIDDIESAVPVVISDPCAVRGPDTTLLGTTESDQTPVPITPAACTYTLSSSSSTVASPAGSGSFTVTTGCVWDAFADQVWITLVDPVAGSGNGTINYTFSENNSTPDRIGHIYVKDKVFTLVQTSRCFTTLIPNSVTLPAQNAQHAFGIYVRAGCTWTATASASWIHFTFLSSGTGTYLMRFSLDDNDVAGAAPPIRVGSITVNDKLFVIYQQGSSTVINPPIVSPGNLHHFRALSSTSEDWLYPAGSIGGDWNPAGSVDRIIVDRLYAFPFILDHTQTIGKLFCCVRTVATGTTTKARMGIYAAKSAIDLYPGNLIVDGTYDVLPQLDLDTSTLGAKSQTVNTVLTEGVYWLVINSTATTLNAHFQHIQGSGNLSLSILGLPEPTSYNPLGQRHIYVASTYPATPTTRLPTTFPASATNVDSNTSPSPMLCFTVTT